MIHFADFLKNGETFRKYLYVNLICIMKFREFNRIVLKESHLDGS